MGKKLFIAEKPSVAKEFAKALKLKTNNYDGYMESEGCVITWCVGHLVTMSYPDVYDEKYKRWTLATIPFIPSVYKYEVIDSVKKQYNTVSKLLNREDVDTIYVCTDSGREGEYIYRLVEAKANVSGKIRKRVWIDSQTEEEILRGIKEAKDLSEYDNICKAAYLRAKEDYLMGINFSRVLTLKYGQSIKNYLNSDKGVVSVGRVMTCVLGMIVKREREVRSFDKTPFYRVLGKFILGESEFDGEWRTTEHSRYYNSPFLYKENGFKDENHGKELVQYLSEIPMADSIIKNVEKKKEVKNPPLLYNLAELQNDCSKLFKISPDETLRYVQEMYEKKMVTYPRTDARVLSTAVSKEIFKNLNGLKNYALVSEYVDEVLQMGSYKSIAKTRYVNDSQITDHYAIIPTGQGLGSLNSLNPIATHIYEIIVRRFLCIFYPASIYQKINLVISIKEECFFSTFKVLVDEGYQKANKFSFIKKTNIPKKELSSQKEDKSSKNSADNQEIKEDEPGFDHNFFEQLSKLKKGQVIPFIEFMIKEGETSPPKRYSSGSIILTMENAGQFIEDEELRVQMKGSGIGTSATRAEILKKLVHINYLALNKKTQIITPTLMGEVIYDVVDNSIKSLLDPSLTASWEKGLDKVACGEITNEEYMVKLDGFVRRRTNAVKQLNNQGYLYSKFDQAKVYYKK
ncbi:MAG TPA: DNA topoisomerase [Lachnospiraceae bacterium]|nr:DNA topoisomerase [Lachnospiraceae bacterium]